MTWEADGHTLAVKLGPDYTVEPEISCPGHGCKANWLEGPPESFEGCWLQYMASESGSEFLEWWTVEAKNRERRQQALTLDGSLVIEWNYDGEELWWRPVDPQPPAPTPTAWPSVESIPDRNLDAAWDILGASTRLPYGWPGGPPCVALAENSASGRRKNRDILRLALKVVHGDVVKIEGRPKEAVLNELAVQHIFRTARECVDPESGAFLVNKLVDDLGIDQDDDNAMAAVAHFISAFNSLRSAIYEHQSEEKDTSLYDLVAESAPPHVEHAKDILEP